MSNTPTPAPAPAPKPAAAPKYKTTGDFMLIDPVSKVEFDPGVATPSELTAFVERRLKLGHLEVAK